MRYKVLRGIARHNGAQHLKGSFFDAEADEVKVQIRKGIVAAAPEKPTTKKPKGDDAE
jgi:hypothetical protein